MDLEVIETFPYQEDNRIGRRYKSENFPWLTKFLAINSPLNGELVLMINAQETMNYYCLGR